jgi:hypothetical protein
MNNRLVIFAFISSLFFAAIYSSVNFVFASSTYCTGTGKTTVHCSTFNTDAEGGPPVFEMDCTYHSSTKKWSCVESPTNTASSPDVPEGLRNAIDSTRELSQK